VIEADKGVQMAHELDTVRKFTGVDAHGDDATAAVAFAKETVGVA
jgi:hypothetical protein